MRRNRSYKLNSDDGMEGRSCWLCFCDSKVFLSSAETDTTFVSGGQYAQERLNVMVLYKIK